MQWFGIGVAMRRHARDMRRDAVRVARAAVRGSNRLALPQALPWAPWPWQASPRKEGSEKFTKRVR